MSNWAVEVENLEKKFPQRRTSDSEAGSETRRGPARLFGRRAPVSWFVAVAGVSFQIERGEVFGLLGPNGAGKSTTIRMLCTLLEPTGGRARVNGFDTVKQSNDVRQSLGTVLAGERSIYWKLTARENLEYFAALYHIPPAVARLRIPELLDRMELSARADDLVEKYSTGMKQRVAIARSLLARPPILLLDEPTLGLDPQAARRVRELVTELKVEGHTVLLTTHYMEEADQLCDRIGIIDQGRIIALDTPAALKRRIGQQDAIRLEVAGWKPELAERVQHLPGVHNLVTRHLGIDSIWEIGLHADDSRAILPRLIENLNQNGAHLVNLTITQPTLEDVFIHLTGKALRD
ncbi:MAG TPA: ATP-binding cassette domain-containing protein [Anaerolineae bacterium]|nr:ATP-binding cassette domain-containing protein [Anaerolineae bacterium]